jgi:uncharacterized protein YpiB (UPF0302 family)
MVDHYIAVQSFLYQIDCSCPDKKHAGAVKINQEDIISVQNDQMIKRADVWYVSVKVNEHRFYMSCDDLNRCYTLGLVLSEMDVELQLNHLHYQIDKALDLSDKSKFNELSQKWVEAKQYSRKFASVKRPVELSV